MVSAVRILSGPVKSPRDGIFRYLVAGNNVASQAIGGEAVWLEIGNVNRSYKKGDIINIESRVKQNEMMEAVTIYVKNRSSNVLKMFAPIGDSFNDQVRKLIDASVTHSAKKTNEDDYNIHPAIKSVQNFFAPLHSVSNDPYPTVIIDPRAISFKNKIELSNEKILLDIQNAWSTIKSTITGKPFEEDYEINPLKTDIEGLNEYEKMHIGKDMSPKMMFAQRYAYKEEKRTAHIALFDSSAAGGALMTTSIMGNTNGRIFPKRRITKTDLDKYILAHEIAHRFQEQFLPAMFWKDNANNSKQYNDLVNKNECYADMVAILSSPKTGISKETYEQVAHSRAVKELLSGAMDTHGTGFACYLAMKMLEDGNAPSADDPKSVLDTVANLVMNVVPEVQKGVTAIAEHFLNTESKESISFVTSPDTLMTSTAIDSMLDMIQENPQEFQSLVDEIAKTKFTDPDIRLVFADYCDDVMKFIRNDCYDLSDNKEETKKAIADTIRKNTEQFVKSAINDNTQGNLPALKRSYEIFIREEKLNLGMRVVPDVHHKKRFEDIKKMVEASIKSSISPAIMTSSLKSFIKKKNRFKATVIDAHELKVEQETRDLIQNSTNDEVIRHLVNTAVNEINLRGQLLSMVTKDDGVIDPAIYTKYRGEAQKRCLIASYLMAESKLNPDSTVAAMRPQLETLERMDNFNPARDTIKGNQMAAISSLAVMLRELNEMHGVDIDETPINDAYISLTARLLIEEKQYQEKNGWIFKKIDDEDDDSNDIVMEEFSNKDSERMPLLLYETDPELDNLVDNDDKDFTFPTSPKQRI